MLGNTQYNRSSILLDAFAAFGPKRKSCGLFNFCSAANSLNLVPDLAISSSLILLITGCIFPDIIPETLSISSSILTILFVMGSVNSPKASSRPFAKVINSSTVSFNLLV